MNSRTLCPTQARKPGAVSALGCVHGPVCRLAATPSLFGSPRCMQQAQSKNPTHRSALFEGASGAPGLLGGCAAHAVSKEGAADCCLCCCLLNYYCVLAWHQVLPRTSVLLLCIGGLRLNCCSVESFGAARWRSRVSCGPLSLSLSLILHHLCVLWPCLQPRLPRCVCRPDTQGPWASPQSCWSCRLSGVGRHSPQLQSRPVTESDNAASPGRSTPVMSLVLWCSFEGRAAVSPNPTLETSAAHSSCHQCLTQNMAKRRPQKTAHPRQREPVYLL